VFGRAWAELPAITRERKCWTLFSATILAGAPSGSVIAQTPDAGCALPSEPLGIPAALDAAIHGARADKDRDCMKALLIPEARMIFVSLGTGGAPAYRMASELLVQVFGERGIHSRSAVSVAQVPFGACVEIDMIAEIEATRLTQGK